MLTRAEWGFIQKLSFKNHLRIDVVGGIVSHSAPWLFGFSKNKKARNTFLAMGAFGLAVGLLTQPEEVPVTEDRGQGTATETGAL